MHGLLTTTKIMQCFGKTLQCIILFCYSCRGCGQDTSMIGIRGKECVSRPESRTSKVSGGLVNFLVY